MNMIANCSFRTRRSVVCLASASNNSSAADLLRAHLDHLHSEALLTTTKGNNARTRLMRLSEAAEKLQRQALTCVRTGKENDARDLLVQKKKIMQALDKTRNRIELLDQLSAQLSKAIAIKENQLIDTVGQDLNAFKEDNSSDPVRIVLPREEQSTEVVDQSAESFRMSEEMETQANDLPSDVISCLRGISSYESFLKRIDKQLGEIEEQLATVLSLSSLVLDKEEKPKNSKVQHTMEIYEDVCRVRARIASIVLEKVETR